ncbi:MAG: hypothetical protein IIY02_03385, partial [Firmicutes bacterium]|nr:hypothetical protein [Bacillota bacterium]
EHEKVLSEMTVAEAEKHINDGQFAPGSMLPKVEAAVNFARSGKGRTAIIASLEKAADAVEGKSGTRIALGENEFDQYYIPTDDPKTRVWQYR